MKKLLLLATVVALTVSMPAMAGEPATNGNIGVEVNDGIGRMNKFRNKRNDMSDEERQAFKDKHPDAEKRFGKHRKHKIHDGENDDDHGFRGNHGKRGGKFGKGNGIKGGFKYARYNEPSPGRHQSL